MTSLTVLVDWLLENTPIRLERPAPASPDLLEALRAQGAPEPLLDVYAVLGSNLTGLLPNPSTGGLIGLVPAMEQAEARQRLQEIERFSQGDFWPLALHGDDAWVFTPDGVLLGFNRPRRVESVFEAMIEAHLAGAFPWHPGLEQYVGPKQVPDADALARILEPVVDDAHAWIETVCAALFTQTDRPVDLGALGKFTISMRRPLPFSEGPATVRIPVFRQGRGLKAALNGDRFDAYPPTFLGVPSADAAHVARALCEGLAAALHEGRPVALGDAGQFGRSTRRAFVGHDPASGESIEVPAVHIAWFRSWVALERAVNPSG